MKIRRLQELSEFVAGDGTSLAEFFNPRHDSSFGARYSLAHARLAPGAKSSPHTLGANELYYIISGEGLIHIAGESEPVGPSEAIEIPAGSIQWLENTGTEDLCFLCIVDPAWRPEDETIL